jgi:integrase
MKPTIRYQIKDSVVYAKITVADIEPQLFSLGISLDLGQWDQRKQICGIPEKQKFLTDTTKTLEDLYMPGKTPEDIWQQYLEIMSAGLEHTIESALRYILEHKAMSDSTADTYRQLQKKAVKYAFGSIRIVTLIPATIHNILKDIRSGDGLSDGSVYTYYSALASAITYYMGSFGLEAQGKIEGIMKAPHIDRGKIQYKTESYCNTDELMDLMRIEFTDDDESSMAMARALFMRQCFTGMAKVDVFNMKKLDDYVVGISEEKWFRYTRHKTKTVCEIPVTEILKKNLEEFVWPIPFGPRQYNNLLKKLGLILGKPLSSHVGRHTFGVIMLEAGFSIETVSKMMGHHSISITEQCYAKITQKRVQEERTTALPKLDSIASFF